MLPHKINRNGFADISINNIILRDDQDNTETVNVYLSKMHIFHLLKLIKPFMGERHRILTFTLSHIEAPTLKYKNHPKITVIRDQIPFLNNLGFSFEYIPFPR